MMFVQKVYAQDDTDLVCNSLEDCVTDPVKRTAGGGIFSDLTSTTNFAINFTLYVVQAFLVILITYSLFKTIYSLFKPETDEDFNRVRSGITNAIIAVLAIILLTSSKFIFITLLKFFGVEDAYNPYLQAP